MIYALEAIALVAILYQLLALLASLRQLFIPRLPAMAPKAVSILKPVRGADPLFYAAIRSNAEQHYPDFEILFGHSDPADAAVPVVNRLAAEFRNVRRIATHTRAPNRKVGVLIDLEHEASGEILIVSDGDIRVPPGYLPRVIEPLADPAIGLVTCVYRARAETWPGRFEALGVATDFSPSAMLAPYTGVNEFGLGSTLAFRRTDLDRIGGFEAIAGYVGDDYMLGRKIHELGLKCVLSSVVVETHLAGESWSSIWRHQVRWARTVRVQRPGGYAGLPVTFATFWALVVSCAGLWPLAAAVMAARMAMAIGAGWLVLRSPDVLRLFWLIPFRDLFAAAVWVRAMTGHTVEWGGRNLRLTRDGKIV